HAFELDSLTNSLEHVCSISESIEKLKNEFFDLVIIDYSMPGVLDYIDFLQQESTPVPVIFITEKDDIADQVAYPGIINCIVRCGSFAQSLPRSVHKAIEADRIKRGFEEAQLHLKFHSLLLENVHDAIISTNLNNEIIYCNSSTERIFGYSLEDILRQNIYKLVPEIQKLELQLNAQPHAEEINTEIATYNATGGRICLQARVKLLKDISGNRFGLLIIAREITEQKALERQLVSHAQDTEIINQILTAITINIEIKKMLQEIVALLTSVFTAKSVRIEALQTREGVASYQTSVETDQQRLEKPQLFMSIHPQGSSDWLISIYKETPNVSQSEIKLFNEICKVVTLGIERASLYEQSQKAAQRELFINRINLAISQSLDINQILQTICEEIGRSLNVSRCYFSQRPEKELITLVTQEYCEPHLPRMLGRSYDRSHFQGLAEKVLQGDPLVIHSTAETLKGLPIAEDCEKFSIKSLVVMPVYNQHYLIGVISLNQCDRERYWQQDEIELVKAVAQQCSVAIQNAQLYIQTKVSENQYRSLFENANDAVVIAQVDTGQIIDANSKAEILTGRSRLELLDLKLTSLILKPEQETYKNWYRQLMSMAQLKVSEIEIGRKDGSSIPAEVTARILKTDHKSLIQIILRDLTKQKNLENQLLHTQRLESIGALAGGIAHDFNNLLAGILGYAELLKKKLDPSAIKLLNYSSIIEQSAKRGAELAQRLVAFSREASTKVDIVALNAIVEDSLKLLSPSLGRSIEFLAELDPNLFPVEGSATLFQQVIMNLCINARDAMPNGGRLKIRTQNISSSDLSHKIIPGEYALLTVRDTGIGIEQDILEKIFEPFFTTKESGKGTGLGLAMVNRIVKELNGYIEVTSEVGVGTEFRVYLPAAKKLLKLDENAESLQISGNETILVVDDEEVLRMLAKDLLETYGYKVLLASDGVQALEIYKQHQKEIALIVLDMMMPRMGGRELYHKILEITPKVKVVLASGYCPPEIMEQIWTEGIMGFVQKPYQTEELVLEVRKALDRK
ncbi:MAG: PAS domain S-box protein, partial [Blastocatellia bacterium]|nr:PAS domain S-box protein [Blastocatellia bacterium]